MNQITLIGGAALLAFSSFAHSAEEGPGCGIGAEVFKGQNGKAANIFAAVVNQIFIPNTIFITTGGGVLGCDPTQDRNCPRQRRVLNRVGSSYGRT